jgi:hypothetical protein
MVSTLKYWVFPGISFAGSDWKSSVLLDNISRFVARLEEEVFECGDLVV